MLWRERLLPNIAPAVQSHSLTMKSRATSKFWGLYRQLPPEISRAAHKQYHLWIQNPRHPSLHFKLVRQSHGRLPSRRDYGK